MAVQFFPSKCAGGLDARLTPAEVGTFVSAWLSIGVFVSACAAVEYTGAAASEIGNGIAFGADQTQWELTHP